MRFCSTTKLGHIHPTKRDKSDKITEKHLTSALKSRYVAVWILHDWATKWIGKSPFLWWQKSNRLEMRLSWFIDNSENPHPVGKLRIKEEELCRKIGYIKHVIYTVPIFSSKRKVRLKLNLRNNKHTYLRVMSLLRTYGWVKCRLIRYNYLVLCFLFQQSVMALINRRHIYYI